LEQGRRRPEGAVQTQGHLGSARPETDALCLNVTLAKNDDATVYRLRIKNRPVDGFRSTDIMHARLGTVPAVSFIPSDQPSSLLEGYGAASGAVGGDAVAMTAFVAAAPATLSGARRELISR
jgi:bifunctional ADP-heptose synthase (sugar kinase/adenylyltransferase)